MFAICFHFQSEALPFPREMGGVNQPPLPPVHDQFSPVPPPSYPNYPPPPHGRGGHPPPIIPPPGPPRDWSRQHPPPLPPHFPPPPRSPSPPRMRRERLARNNLADMYIKALLLWNHKILPKSTKLSALKSFCDAVCIYDVELFLPHLVAFHRPLQ